jgi:hypothetical protein
MKKLILIILLTFLTNSSTYAEKSYLDDFNDFLSNNTEFISKNNIRGLKKVNLCKDEKKYSKKWYKAGCENRPGGVFGIKNTLDIKFYKDRNNIPWDKNPNYDTLLYYGFVSIEDDSGFKNLGSKGSREPYKFSFDLREDRDVKKEIQETGLLSYLLYEDGKITVDEKTSKDRFGIFFDDNRRWTSNSMGKSIASYVVGHTICEGYIDGINTKLNDWPLIKNSLYYDQKILDLLNMAAGDQKYSKLGLTKGGKWSKNPNRNTIKFHMEKGIFKKTLGKKNKSKWNYSNIVSNMLISYASFKSGENFQNLLDKIFISKVKIENPVGFKVMHASTVQRNYKVNEKNDGAIRYSFVASRYDYLRIAKAMLDDWQNDTCVGKYLKILHKNKIPKNDQWKDNASSWFNPKSYAGQFHTDYAGFKDRAVMGMDGASGQSIIIDFDKGTIVAINSIHSNYNWKKIAISKFN